jgi:nucleoid DNA-binding protein
MSTTTTTTTRSTIPKVLADQVAAHLKNEYETADIQRVGAALFDVILSSLKPGKDIVLTNCIKFHLSSMKERIYSNPQNEVKTTKGAHYAVRVSVMPAVKKRFEGMAIEGEVDVDVDADAVSDDAAKVSGKKKSSKSSKSKQSNEASETASASASETVADSE